MEGGCECDLAAGGQGFWQDHLYDIDILGMVLHFGFQAVDVEVQAIDIAPLLLSREIKIRSAIAEQLFAEGGAIVLVGVGPAMHPDEEKGIGGMVGVAHADDAIEGFVGIIEADVDVVIDLLLPVRLGMGRH